MANPSFDVLEEQIAKAKADLDFLLKAREVLGDPRIAPLLSSQLRPISLAPSSFTPPGVPRAYGELKSKVYLALPAADSRSDLTTQKIVELLQVQGYVFQAKEPTIAVNGALVALEAEGLAKCVGKIGNAKLWRKGAAKSQEATEVAS